MDQVSKESVDYREGNMQGKHCGNCVMFHGKKSSGSGYVYEIGTCDLVEGSIKVEAVCDRWEAKVEKSDPQMDLIQLDQLAGKYNWLAMKAEELRYIDRDTSDKYSSQCWAISVDSYPTLVKLFDAGYLIEPEKLGWDFDQIVLEPVRKWLIKSEQTPYLSTHHSPIGHEGLWHTPSKKVPHKEQLPAYIQNVRNALMRAGHGEQEAHAMAVAAVKRWASGQGAWGHKGKVTPVVREAAQRAVAEWEGLRAEHDG